jgi:hypothetical protein
LAHATFLGLVYDRRVTLRMVCFVALIVGVAGCGGSHHAASLQGQAPHAGDRAYISVALRTLPPVVSGLFPGKPASRSQLLSFGPCCNRTRAIFRTEMPERGHGEATVRFVESWRIHGGFGSHTWERVILPQSLGDKITKRQDFGDTLPQLIP